MTPIVSKPSTPEYREGWDRCFTAEKEPRPKHDNELERRPQPPNNGEKHAVSE